MTDQQQPRIAFQGERGAFSEEAIRRFLGDDATPVPCRVFADVGSALFARDADAAVLPVENSIHGSVLPTYDLLATGRLEVHAAVVQPIRLCLMARPGIELEAVRRVRSHPVALGQCDRYLRGLGVEAVATADTAGAAREVAGSDDDDLAAIASYRAATVHGLRILARDVQDRADNQTRFFLVTRSGESTPMGTATAGERRVLLLVDTPNTPGSLVAILQPFASRGINLARLEARPAGSPWSYRFFIEIAVPDDPAELGNAIRDVERRAERVQQLGAFGARGISDPDPAGT